MALIVETGAGLPNADSYISVEEADAYLLNLGNEVWALMDTPAKEVALRKATKYMVAFYRMKWKGARTSLTQSLDWPRYGVSTIEDNGQPSYGYGVVPYDVVPVEIKHVCADFAALTTLGDLSENFGQKVLQETIGPITVKYSDNSSQIVQYREIDSALAPFMGSTGSGPMVKLRRC